VAGKLTTTYLGSVDRSLWSYPSFPVALFGLSVDIFSRTKLKLWLIFVITILCAIFIIIVAGLAIAPTLTNIYPRLWIDSSLLVHFVTVPLWAMFAVFYIRSNALESWHIPNVFTTLPPILHRALVLFIAGLIDFVKGLGHRCLIPGTVFDGVTLLFLISTMILLWIQGFILYILTIFLRSTVPSQCPYKSPQSSAFWSTLKILFAPSSFISKPLRFTDLEFIFCRPSKLLHLDLECGDGEEHYCSQLRSMLVRE
jgi:hypothetical protein